MTLNDIINYSKQFGVDFESEVLIDKNKLIFLNEDNEVNITIELDIY